MDGQIAGSLLNEALGGVAGTLTTVSFVPQVVKTLRSKSTRDISLSMWVLFTAGVAVWIAYGIAIGSVSVIAANGVTLALAATVLIVKLGNLKAERSARVDDADP